MTTKWADKETVDALNNIAKALQDLGNADANTRMGGLEGLGRTIRGGLADLALALDGVAAAIRERQ